MGHHCSINRVQACLGSRGQLKGGICNDYEPNAVFFHGLPLPQYYEGGKDPNDLSAGTLRPPLSELEAEVGVKLLERTSKGVSPQRREPGS